jgi:hypothetical protein
MNEMKNDAVERLTSRVLGDLPHGFFGRRGGVSTGILAGLDMGRRGQAEISPELAENRRRVVADAMPGATLVTVHQVHSPDCVTITGPVDDDDRPKADALATNRPGLLLGILTADCVPVLFADAQAGVVGAAHAGWKGAMNGVTDSTIAAMEALGADRTRITAAIGPCIGRASYEVGDDFALRFEQDAPENERFFIPGRPGHQIFDIEGYVAHRLAQVGISRVDCLGEDTLTQPERFFSYRRSCHNGEPDYGRQISVIGINI